METIALFGASGRTGNEILKLALAKCFKVNAFCRDKNRITFDDDNLRIIEGNVMDLNDVGGAIANSNYVISTLGPKKPFADIFCYEAMKNIVVSMSDYKVKRLICITGAMIGDSNENLSRFMKYLKRRFDKSYPRSAIDRLKQEFAIKASGLDWTIIKPPRLNNGSLGKYIAGEKLDINAFSSISRKTITALILEILDDKSTYKKAMFAIS